MADLPRRSGYLAVRSASIKGKGNVEIVVRRTHYDEAVRIYQESDYGLAVTDGVETKPRLGVVPDEESDDPVFQRATRADAVRALLETKQPYGDVLHKFLALVSMIHWETDEMQRKMEAPFTKAQLSQHSSLFFGETRNALPKMGLRVVHDTGAGAAVDYDGGVRSGDSKVLWTFGGGTIGGSQNGDSGEEGSRRTVAIGSAEDERLKVPDVAATTVTESTMLIALYDGVVLAARG